MISERCNDVGMMRWDGLLMMECNWNDVMKSERLWNDGTIRWRAGERRNDAGATERRRRGLVIVLESLRYRFDVAPTSFDGHCGVASWRETTERKVLDGARTWSVVSFRGTTLARGLPSRPSRTTVEVRFVTERRSTDSIPLSGVVSFRGGAGLGEGLGSQSFCRRFGVVPRNFRRGTTRER